jgi:hypothetical protein
VKLVFEARISQILMLIGSTSSAGGRVSPLGASWLEMVCAKLLM